jgi:hypothetical protein
LPSNVTKDSAVIERVPWSIRPHGLYPEDMEQQARTVRVIVGLIEKQRRLADSPDPFQRAQTLWLATELDKRLSRCSDWEIAELLGKAEERLPIWEPEFAVVEHARRRLMRSGQMSLLPEEEDWEGVATGDAMGRLFVTIISAIAELERSLVVERVKSGMRRARLEGRQIGRSRLDVNREHVIQDRRSGMSLTQVAKKHGISRASVCRLMKEAKSKSHSPVLLEGTSFVQEAHV